MAAGDTITKTVWQYSEALPEDTMEFLRGIARDYSKVKNCVYERYSGIKNLDRLTPVYDILTEMRHCGLREQLKLPVVYYELAIADAVADIKGRWGTVKNKIGTLITANENISDNDRIYLRTVLKINSVYAAVLNRQEYEMPKNAESLDINVKRLNNLLCRLTRKYLTQPEAGRADSFKISPNGYSYKDGAMRIVCRIPRKRVPIPLKDNRTFDRQIQVHIVEGGLSGDNYVALAAPVEAKIKKHKDYTNTVYIHIGYRDMFTLSNGNIYGEGLGDIVTPETERLDRKNRERHRIRMLHMSRAGSGDLEKAGNIEANNLGKLKYDRRKEKERHRTETFINTEINRMLKTEKPAKVVITRPIVLNRTLPRSKTANRRLSRSFYSYIRERLAYKCQVNSVELLEVNSNGTGSTCSFCKAAGKRQGGEFICESCGARTTISYNSAKNIEMKYNGQQRPESVPGSVNPENVGEAAAED